jgi:uncharacterized protein (DUF1697 family)
VPTVSRRTWVALLRGINVGGHKRMAMADLRALLESLGYEAVRTLLQSGNAAFTAQGSAPQLERAIASRITQDLGMDVKVLVRSSHELAKVFAGNPFLARGVAPKELHAAFLSTTVAAGKIAGLDRDKFAPDEFDFGDRVIYLHLPNGMAASVLPNWDRFLGLDVTVRNWNTVTRLHQLAC